uniref:Doublecortin-like kinase 3 n=1 Tax=Esox lucius TaxID=8010 RepID=A0AAY5KFU6_ESOLU
MSSCYWTSLRRWGSLAGTGPTGRIKEESISQSECLSDSKQEKVGTKYEVLFDLPSDDSVVTLSDIERCYDIGHIIGDGNFAVVRECRRHDNGEAFAMKIVERSKLIGREHMMQNELSLMGSLSHPRVVRLLTHHHTHTHSYLVMEMVAGGDLFEAIAERGKYPEEEAGLMVCDVSEALTYIHSKSIVHRDLKPENLLVREWVDSVTRLKLGDFGLAMVVTEPIFTVCGTPTYVAPEILSETGYGLPVDLWALGVILYILLCGFPPFRSRNRDQEELFQLVREGQLTFLSPYWDDISDGETFTHTNQSQCQTLCQKAGSLSNVMGLPTTFWTVQKIRKQMFRTRPSNLGELEPRTVVCRNMVMGSACLQLFWPKAEPPRASIILPFLFQFRFNGYISFSIRNVGSAIINGEIKNCDQIHAAILLFVSGGR